jgi:PAS domain S-box-containing protein
METKADQRAVLAARLAGFVTWEIDAETLRIVYDTGLAHLFGLEPGQVAESIVDFVARIHPDDLEPTLEALKAAKVPGGRYFAVFRVGSEATGWRWLRGAGEGVATREGVRIVGFNVDITREREAAAALRASEAFTRSILESSPDCIKVMSLDGRLDFFSDGGLCAMEVDDFGRQLRGVEWATLWQPEDQPKVREALAQALAGGTGRFQAALPTLKGTPKWWDVTVSAIRDDSGCPDKLVAISRDITELHRAEEDRQLLVEELDHRLKNLFGIAAGMVSMTARHARTPAEMAAALSGRLMAMSRAHDLIRSAVAARGRGGESVSVEGLLQVLLEPHLPSEQDGVHIYGPLVQAGPKATTSLALVFHELATNAAKYGALSAPQGELEVSWTVDSGHLLLTWRETGSPPIESPPDRKGFGSQLVRLGVTGQLGGSIQHDWQRAGVAVSLVIPLEQLAE